MKNLLLFLFFAIVFCGCKKDYSYEGGTLIINDSSAQYNCTGVSINGIYMAGTPLAITDAVVESINVTKTGYYSVKTDTVNGIYFIASGNFAVTGAQTISLVGVGTPLAAGNFTYKPSDGNSCSFTVTIAAATIANANYTLVGAPSTCTGFIVHGLYVVGVPLNFRNYDTVVVQVNVTTAGVYSLSTDTVNGMSFSRSGIFTSTGIQNVTLVGSGVPTVAETSTFTPKIGTSHCSFDIVIGLPGLITCKIDGVFNSFNVSAQGVSYQTPFQNFYYNFGITGEKDTLGSELFDFSFYNKNGYVDTGTYTIPLPNGYSMEITYIQQTSGYWINYGYLNGPPFKIVISAITPTRITGTFSATIFNDYGSGPLSKSFTEGVFDVPRLQ